MLLLLLLIILGGGGHDCNFEPQSKNPVPETTAVSLLIFTLATSPAALLRRFNVSASSAFTGGGDTGGFGLPRLEPSFPTQPQSVDLGDVDKLKPHPLECRSQTPIEERDNFRVNTERDSFSSLDPVPEEESGSDPEEGPVKSMRISSSVRN